MVRLVDAATVVHLDRCHSFDSVVAVVVVDAVAASSFHENAAERKAIER